eukprot:2958998-Prymnesium_polylepis.1
MCVCNERHRTIAFCFGTHIACAQPWAVGVVWRSLVCGRARAVGFAGSGRTRTRGAQGAPVLEPVRRRTLAVLQRVVSELRLHHLPELRGPP